MFVAAACNNSIGDDVMESTIEDGPVLTYKGNNSSISAMPIKETMMIVCVAATVDNQDGTKGDICTDKNETTGLINNEEKQET